MTYWNSTYDLSTALKLLVFQRILNPDSKLATVKSQVELFGNWDIHLNAIYCYFDKLDEIKMVRNCISKL